MENFITGYPANESAMRDAVSAVLRAGRGLLRSVAGPVLRRARCAVPGVPGCELRAAADQPAAVRARSGFRTAGARRSRSARPGSTASSTCTRCRGCQNQHWHSDNPTHVAAFWRHPHFMDRVTALWVELASRFAGNEWVAGYNLLNEPADPTGEVVGPLHERTVAAIRDIDPDHILFLDGNTYSTDFSAFGEPFANAIYACHDYAGAGMAFGDGRAVPEQLEEKFRERTATSVRPGRRSGWVSSGRSTPGARARRGAVGGARPAGAVRALRRGLVAVDLQGRRPPGPRVRGVRLAVHAALR